MKPYEIGAARLDVTPFVPGVGMYGWGRFDHEVRFIESPLFGRAVVVFDPNTGKKFAMVCIEICFITQSIYLEVTRRLKENHPEIGIGEGGLHLTATHTHSAPGGFSHYAFYNITVPGYAKEVFEVLVKGIVSVIVEANKKIKPATIRLATGEFGEEVPVAFNRSVKAWNANPENPKYNRFQRAKALDRSMTLIRIDGVDGSPIAMWNWFAVHPTSVHSDNKCISSDNKGYAARSFEQKYEHLGFNDFVGVFAQTATADVSPNFQRFFGFTFKKGRFRNDFKSAKYNGRLQRALAEKLYEECLKSEPLSGPLDFNFAYFDFSKIDIEPEFCNGLPGQKTGPAALGASFMKGTSEGPGAPAFIGRIMALLHLMMKRIIGAHTIFAKDDPIQGKKQIVFETGTRRFLGTWDFQNIVIPDWVHPVIKRLRAWAKSGALGTQPLTPHVLPLQIVQFGALAVLNAPTEFTTTAGRRLRDMLARELASKGVKKVLVCGYSNSYAGYCATYEEYQLQGYEGGSTHFGKWTHAAYMTLAQKMAKELLKPTSERVELSTAKPYRFTDEELSKRAFVTSKV